MAIFSPSLALRAAGSILNDLPVAVSWFVTNRCNFRCDFCDYPDFNNDKRRELTLEDFEAIGHKLARAGVTVVALIGGEPFIRKDLPDIVAILSRDLIVQITTNGWFVDEERARRVFAAGAYMVNVSLDSSNPDVHNAGRGNPRSFERAIEAVKTLRDAPKIAEDQRVGFESILSGRNFAEVEEMVALAASLDVHVVYQPYSAGHTGDGLDDMSGVDGDATARLLELREKYPSALYNGRAMIERFTPFFRSGRVADCQAGRTYFNVDCYGHITRCEEQRRRYGDLKTMSVGQIRRALRQIREDTLADGCDTCYLRTRGETEPLYADDLVQFLVAAEDMFGVKLPRVVPLIARLPGLRAAVKAGLGLRSLL